MPGKILRFSSVAIFLGIILITMLLSRAEERRKEQAATRKNQTTVSSQVNS